MTFDDVIKELAEHGKGKFEVIDENLIRLKEWSSWVCGCPLAFLCSQRGRLDDLKRSNYTDILGIDRDVRDRVITAADKRYYHKPKDRQALLIALDLKEQQ